MLGRIFWRLVTPRQLRRWTLALLVVWIAAAVANQHGMFGDLFVDGPHERLPMLVDAPGV